MNINFIFRSCSCNSNHDFRINRFVVASGHQFKKTKSLLVLLAMLLFVPSIQTLAQSKMVGNSTAGYETSTAGTSMEKAVLSVNNVADLVALCNGINSGKSFKLNGTSVNKYGAGSTFNLSADLDLSSVCGANIGNWTPIGTASSSFQGVFNGNGHTISNLYINSSSDYQGLFGNMKNASISNLNLVNTNVKGKKYVGGFCGFSDKTAFSNCTNSGSVIGTDDYVGGFCGLSQNQTSYSKCLNNASVSGIGTWSNQVGGLCGQMKKSMIRNCMNSGSISGRDWIGGLCGWVVDNSDLQNCLNIGDVSSPNGNGGSVCAKSYGCDVSNSYYDKQMCFAFGAVNGYDDNINKVLGKKTNAMTGTALQSALGSTDWAYANNAYPRPKGIENTNAAIAAAKPIFLASSENVTEVTTNFTVGIGNGVTWETYGNGSSLIVSGANVTVDCCGNDTLVAKINGIIYKMVALNIPYSEAHPYSIDNVADLQAFRNGINQYSSFSYKGNNVPAGGAGTYFKLTADLDLSSVCGENKGSWETIGNASFRFQGHFNGGGHSISNLYINTSSSIYQGLFGNMRNGSIRNLNLVNSYVIGKQYVGSLCGYISSSTISNCTNSGSVNATEGLGGGICGMNTFNGNIDHCANDGIVNGKLDIGGICGYNNEGTISNCINSSRVSASNDYAGGVSGGNNSTISNCINCGSVIVGKRYLGGIVGDNLATISNCYYDKQMCTVGGINSIDVAEKAEGKLTTEMAGTALQAKLGTTDWTFASGMYPRPKGIENTNAAIVAAAPIFLAATDANSYETVDGVATDFTYSGTGSITWSSTQGYLTFDNGNATLSQSGDDIITASYSNASKSIALKIRRPINVSISGMSAVCDGNSITLTANSDATTPTYKWYKNGSLLTGSTSQTLTVAPTTTTVYKVRVTETYHNANHWSEAEKTITVSSSNTGDTTVVACDRFTWHGTEYTSTPSVAPTYTLTNAAGCDSVVTLHLTINESNTGDTTVVECDRFTWHGIEYTSTPSVAPTYTLENAAGCDSVVTLHLTINESNTGDTTVVECDRFTWHGIEYTSTPSVAPTYTLENAAGCDSVVTLHLTINASETNEFSATACDEYTWNATTYNTSGDYEQTFQNTLACDSVVTLHLTINASETNEFSATACDEYTWNATTYNTSGDYEQTFQNTLACDSVVTLHLTINASETNEFSATACDEYTWNTTTYNTSGDYEQTFQNTLACDSVVTLHLTINASETNEFSATACDEYTWNATTYNTSGDYEQTFQNTLACDSVVTLHLTINASETNEFSATACDEYTWNATTYNTSGDYVQTFQNTLACDSVVTLHLTINASETNEFSATACDEYTWNATTYNTSGDYEQTFQNTLACDSVVTLHLTINASETNEFSATACDEYTWNATTYNTSGDYEQTFQNTLACDSVVTLHLTINASETNEFSATACDEYTWNATTYNTSGDYEQTFQNTLACDSVVTLHLTINASETNEFSATACDEYTWNATTYNTSGDYEQTFQNTLACDSVVTLHLTINASETNEFSATACDEYTWNNTTYDASGDYEQTFQNTLACDSVVTLHLTINASETNEFSATACDEYTWNATTYNTSGDYEQTFQNTLACDSVVTLHLTINASETNEFSATACDEYTWNATTYNTSGDYEQTFQNTLACDSVVTLHLTINASETNEFSATACDEYTWNTTTYNTSGDYEQTFQNTLACDSVVTLHLTINASETNEFSETVCNSYTWNATNYATSGDYEQTLQNVAGCDSIVTLHLTVNHAPSISAITAPNTIVPGESLTLTAPQITENGSSVTAQGWQISNTMDFSETVEDYTGQTLDYTYSNWYLRYFATSDCGTSYSNVVQISVLGYPVIGTVAQPEPICNGEALSLVAPSVDFRQQTDLGQGWQLAEANTFANAIAYTNQTLDHSYNNWYLRYFATNAAGTSYSDTLQITVNPEVTVNAVESQILCNGEDTDAISFGTTTVGGTMSYSWTNSNTSIGLAANGNGNIASFAAVNNGSAPQVATITVTPTLSMNGIECQGNATSFTITVNPTAVVNAVDSQVLCNGDNTSDVLFTTTNTGGTMRYAWTNDNTSIGLAANGEGNISSFAAVNDGTAPVVATITVTPYFTNEGVECSGETESFTITVNPTAVVNAIADQVLCNGDNTSDVLFTTTNTGGTMRYVWTNDNTSIGLAANGEGNISSFAAVNDGTAPIVATIIVTPYFTNEGVECSGETESFTITVNPTAVVNAVDSQVLCNGDNTSDVLFSTTNTGGTMRYAWTNDNTSIGLAANGEGNISSFAAVNDGTAPVVATITVTPYFTNEGVECDGETESFTITVNPTAVVNAIADQVLCNGDNTSDVVFTTTNTGGTMRYAWTNDNTSIGLAANGEGNISSFAAVNDGTAPVVATITVTPYFTNEGVECSGETESFTITVNPTPVITISEPENNYCSGSTITLSAVMPVGAYPMTVVWGGDLTPETQYYEGPRAFATFTLPVTDTDVNYNINIQATDANGCISDIDEVVVSVPAQLVASVYPIVSPYCHGGNDGHAVGHAIGGVAPYRYEWSTTPAFVGQYCGNLSAGTYSLTVTDAYGCTDVVTFEVEDATAVVAEINGYENPTCGNNNGWAEVSATGGHSGYTYLWSNGKTTRRISGLAAGTYSVTVTDDNGCQATASVTLTEADAITLNVTTHDVTCNGGNDGHAIASVDGGMEPYSIRWSNNHTGEYINQLSAGSYSVTVTDANGCEATESFVINEPAALNAGSIATEGEQIEVGGNPSEISSVADATSGVEITYRWKVNGTVIENSDAASFDPSSSYGNTVGSYTFTREVKDACNEWTLSEGEWILTVVRPDGISEEDAHNLQVYPNPTKGNTKVVCQGMSKITILTMTGQVVAIENVDADETILSLGSYIPGVYMVRIETADGNVFNRRVTVAK